MFNFVEKMKKLIFLLSLIVTVFSTNLFSQQKKVEIYTTIQKAKFIPYINNVKMTDSPVDTFTYKVETDQIVNLKVDFVDKRIIDLFIPIDFNGIKFQKYKIVYKSKNKKQLEYLESTPQNDTLLDLFTLKNESFKNYLKNINN